MSHAEEMGKTLDVLASYVFVKAVKDGRAGELLYHLFDGGGVTVDPETKEMVLLPASVFDQFASPKEKDPAT